MGPLHVKCTDTQAGMGYGLIDVFPLYSWYHSSWDQEPDLEDANAVKKEKVWRLCDMCMLQIDSNVINVGVPISLEVERFPTM